MDDPDLNIENSWAWRCIPAWLMQIWMVWILVTFFVIRILGSQAAETLLKWYRHWR